MSKATIANITALGFDAQQFGNPSDWATATTGYLALILSDKSIEVQAAVGDAAYADAVTGGTTAQLLAFTRLKDAEVALVEAELWRRLEAFERTQAVAGRDGQYPESMSSRLLKNAEAAEDRAWAAVAKVNGARGGGPSTEVLQSGPFTEVTL